MEWTRDGLQAAGCSGFVPLLTLDRSAVPSQPGVYVVFREHMEFPTFRAVNPAGHFKGKDPSVTLPQLQAAWVPGASVLYVGKAAHGRRRQRGLHKRLDEYRRHGCGEPVGHWGGRYIWQLADCANLLIAWKPTPEQDPEVAESRFLDDFKDQYDRLPFANRKAGKSKESPDSSSAHAVGKLLSSQVESIDIIVHFDHDPEANAASLVFDTSARGRQLQTYPFESNGQVLGTVTFDADGALVDIELLDAARQIPHRLRRGRPSEATDSGA